MFGTRPHFDRLGASSPRPSHRTTPMHGPHVRRVTSPRSLTDNSQPGLTKSISDHNLHNLSESSAYSLIDTYDFLDLRDNVTPERGSANNSSHSRSRTADNRSHATSQSRPTGIEILDNILESDRVPLLPTHSRSERVHTNFVSSASLSPPQRQEAARSFNNDTSQQQTLKEQLESKKKAAGLTQENGVDGNSLDPIQW
jgi:hypothetical protein